ncbi:MAG TPA: filamentous hemagglutinin N-terminal domain-containing protein [Candidatus Sericytochromatia bacterium]
MTSRRLYSIFITCTLLGVSAASGNAQIVPDATLPVNSVVTLNGSTFAIGSGTTVGGNLFHSFSEFSVPNQMSAFFNNALTINNIITRVTGGQISNIEGNIRANGTANLFLLNPNGIIFGSGAQLNIGGSFIGTTANSLKFADGGEFSAISPQASPLLTLNVPIGLQFGTNPAPIVNRSVANSLVTGTPRVGLQTPGKTLALVGGDLLLEGGNLSALQGQIELGSVGTGVVSLTPTATGFGLGYQGIQNGTIKLTGGAAVNASGLGGGTIRLRGGQVTLAEGAKLVAETFGDINGGGIDIQANQFNLQGGAFVSTATFGAGEGGNLTVRAETVELIGTTPLQTSQQLLTGTFNPLNLSNGLFSLSAGSGRGGDLIIDAKRLVVQNGVNLFTSTFVSGIAGNLTVISDSAEFTNGSLLFTGTAGTGNAGTANISAKHLRVLDGSAISTTPGGTSTGRGGNLNITADVVELRGTPGGALIPGGLFTTTLGTRDAGDLSVTTGQLLISNGAQISASSAGSGRGGNLTVTADSVDLSGNSPDGRFLSGLFTSSSLLTVSGQQGTAPSGDLSITTRRLIVRDGGQISAATGSDGAAGNLRVNASESVEVRGFATNIDPSVEQVSFGVIGDGIVPSAIDANSRGGGKAGDLTIGTGRLTIRDGAEIGVRSISSGSAGNLQVTADSILLEQGTISALKITGTGGNIELNAQNLQLNNGIINASVLGNGTGGDISITTSALIFGGNSNVSVSSLGTGNAGNISMSADRVVLNQGAITATSFLGKGGNITVQVKEDLVLRNRSEISTRAGIEDTGGGDGGNITLTTGVLAVLENSNINANAFQGKGGNIQIYTQGVFVSPDSAITASSEQGINGVVRINSPDIDPSSAIVELPTDVTDASNQITTGCAADRGNKFVITGQGGLPSNPTQLLQNQAAWQDWRFLDHVETGVSMSSSASQMRTEEAIGDRKTSLVEATSWQVNQSGEVELVAHLPNAQGSWYQSARCN